MRRERIPYADGQNVQIAGIIQQMKMKTTRNNTIMAYVTLEDDTGGHGAIGLFQRRGALTAAF